MMSPLPLLQLRSADQVAEGLLVATRGRAREPETLARLVQDAAQLLADDADVPMRVRDLRIKRWWEEFGQGIQGRAQMLDDGTGRVTLDSGTRGRIEAGIRHLREEPFDRWKEQDRRRFVEAVAVAFHEGVHLTHRRHDAAFTAGTRVTNQMNEGLASLITELRLADFMSAELGAAPAQAELGANLVSARYSRLRDAMAAALAGTGADTPRETYRAALHLNAHVAESRWLDWLVGRTVAREVAMGADPAVARANVSAGMATKALGLPPQ